LSKKKDIRVVYDSLGRAERKKRGRKRKISPERSQPRKVMKPGKKTKTSNHNKTGSAPFKEKKSHQGAI